MQPEIIEMIDPKDPFAAYKAMTEGQKLEEYIKVANIMYALINGLEEPKKC